MLDHGVVRERLVFQSYCGALATKHDQNWEWLKSTMINEHTDTLFLCQSFGASRH